MHCLFVNKNNGPLLFYSFCESEIQELLFSVVLTQLLLGGSEAVICRLEATSALPFKMTDTGVHLLEASVPHWLI
jgi:hypothetical protein